MNVDVGGGHRGMLDESFTERREGSNDASRQRTGRLPLRSSSVPQSAPRSSRLAFTPASERLTSGYKLDVDTDKFARTISATSGPHQRVDQNILCLLLAFRNEKKKMPH